MQGDKGYHLLLDVKLQDCNSSVFIPNVFTPNHDGVNDVFQPIMQNAELINCQIYNRWGSCIYQSAHEMIWDGSYKGRNLDPGVYMFILKYKNTLSGEIITRSGNVTLIR